MTKGGVFMTKEEMRENIRVNLINLRVAKGMNQTEVGNSNKRMPYIDFGFIHCLYMAFNLI